MKKVGILGGTFDPPHHGHLLIANEVLSALDLDEVWLCQIKNLLIKKSRYRSVIQTA